MKKVVTLNMYDICNKIYFFYTHRVPLTGLKNPPKFASRPTCGFLALLIVATNQVLFLNSSSLASIISSHEKLLCDLRSNRARRKKKEEHEFYCQRANKCNICLLLMQCHGQKRRTLNYIFFEFLQCNWHRMPEIVVAALKNNLRLTT